MGPLARVAIRGRAVGHAVAYAVSLLALLVGRPVPAADPGEVRVRSGPGAASRLTIRIRPDGAVEDRTPGAVAVVASAKETAAFRGDTFAGEITLFLPALVIARPASVEVGDPVVSAVRLFPERDGTTVKVFVRQPVKYTVSRPSKLGDVVVDVRGKTRPLEVTTTPRGRQRVRRPKTSGEQEVAVDAESLAYDEQTNVLTARGGVTLTQGDTTLTADEVRYNRSQGVAEAEGHVVVTDPQGTMTGSAAHLRLEDETGWIDNADGRIEPSGYSLMAGRVEKKGGPCYSVANGVFTTCECGGLERPSWSIAGKQTDVELEGTGVVRGATFRVKDVPVLYVPYFAFPAATERQTGFLLPRFGHSSTRGFQYEQPFYWAINKSSDATIGLDVETEARIGAIGEYRYALSRQTRGEFAGAYYNESIRQGTQGTIPVTGDPEDIPENRFMIAGRHRQPFYGGSKFYLDLFAVSDNQFLREIDSFTFIGAQDWAVRSTRLTTSRAEVLKTWHGGLAGVRGIWHQDLIDPQDVTLQRLPTAFAEHGVPILGDRAVARMAGEATDFWRDEGYDGLRADLAPELFVPFRVGRFLGGSVSGQVRETAYHLFNRNPVAVVVPNPRGRVVLDEDFERFRAVPGLFPDLDENRNRAVPIVHGRIGTSLQRVFPVGFFGLSRVMHTIEPEAQYLYVPTVKWPDASIAHKLPRCNELPESARRRGINCGVTLFGEGFLFDERDAINQRNFVSYGFSTRLLVRRTTTSAKTAAHPRAPDDPKERASLLPDDEEPGERAAGDPNVGDEESDASPPTTATATAPAEAVPTRTQSRELARASVLAGYDISRALVRDLDPATARVINESHLSDVDLGLRLAPIDLLTVAYNATLGVRDGSVRGQNVTMLLRERWAAPPRLKTLQSPSGIGISYRFVDENVNEDVGVRPPDSFLFNGQGVNELDGSVYLRLGNHLGFAFLSRYTFDDAPVLDANGNVISSPHFLERDYLLRLISRCNCWVLDVGFADKFNPDERVARVQLTLVGLGSLGRGAGTSAVGVAPLLSGGARRALGIGGVY